MASTPHRSRFKVMPRRVSANLWLAYDSFMLSLQAARRSPRTVEYYREKLRPFIARLEERGVTEVAGIRSDHIRAFLLEREQAGRAALTVHLHAACIKAWCNFLVGEDLLAASLMRKVKMPKVDQRILLAFTPDDVKKLLAATWDARDTAIILCLLDTGCRASEFCALNVGDVNMETGAVTIRLGKGGRDRVAFLGLRARRAVNRYFMERGQMAPDRPLWLRKSADRKLADERLTRSALRFLLDRLGQRAGVEHCHPHTFRRTTALWSLRAGMNIYAWPVKSAASCLPVLLGASIRS